MNYGFIFSSSIWKSLQSQMSNKDDEHKNLKIFNFFSFQIVEVQMPADLKKCLERGTDHGYVKSAGFYRILPSPPSKLFNSELIPLFPSSTNKLETYSYVYLIVAWLKLTVLNTVTPQTVYVYQKG